LLILPQPSSAPIGKASTASRFPTLPLPFWQHNPLLLDLPVGLGVCLGVDSAALVAARVDRVEREGEVGVDGVDGVDGVNIAERMNGGDCKSA